MSALTELNDKWERGELKDPTPLQELLLYEDSKYHEAAAAELAALTERVGRLEAERNEIAKAIRVTLEDGTAPDNLVEHVQFLMVEEYDPMMKRIDGLRAREICAGCGMKRIDAIKAVIKGAAACCPDCTTMTVDERNAVREALQEAQ